jgi:hypothetical protein
MHKPSRCPHLLVSRLHMLCLCLPLFHELHLIIRLRVLWQLLLQLRVLGLLQLQLCLLVSFLTRLGQLLATVAADGRQGWGGGRVVAEGLRGWAQREATADEGAGQGKQQEGGCRWHKGLRGAG